MLFRSHLDVVADLHPDLRFDAVVVDSSLADASMAQAANRLGAELLSARLHVAGNPHLHDPELLAKCISGFLESALPTLEGDRAWQ